MTALLARYAGCIFWMARYIERAENLARLLDVNEVFCTFDIAGHPEDAPGVSRQQSGHLPRAVI